MPSSTSNLKASVGFRSAVSIIVGTIIGAGIFTQPAEMAAQLGSPLILMLVWLLAGGFSLLGALIYAELGSMIPETGGLYTFFKKLYGDFPAFLFGWSALVVINTASIAAIAFICARYGNELLHLPRLTEANELSVVWHIPFIGDLFPLKDLHVKLLAMAIVTVFTLVNYQSTKAGSRFQLISTMVKVLAILMIIFGIAFSGSGDTANFSASGISNNHGLLAGIMAAMTGAFFAYDGWINITYMGGEVRDPQRNIPRSLFTGVFICIALYILVNLAYLYVLPIDTMGRSSLVATDAMTAAWGTISGNVIALLIVICTLGAVNGNVMATARVTFAMGKDGLLAKWTGREHKKNNTPGNSLLLQGAWTLILILTGSFSMLANMFIFVSWIAYGLGAWGLFKVRRMDHASSYRAWGHPYSTLLFVIFTVYYLVFTVYTDIENYNSGQAPVINSLLG